MYLAYAQRARYGHECTPWHAVAQTPCTHENCTHTGKFASLALAYRTGQALAAPGRDGAEPRGRRTALIPTRHQRPFGMMTVMDNTLWGMPVEVAAGLVSGMVGAFLGTTSALWVSHRQAREQLRQARWARLDEEVADLHALCLELLDLQPDAAAPMPSRQRTGFVRRALRLETRARGLSPSLAATALAAGYEHPFTHRTVMVLLWRLNAWLRDPDKFERMTRPFDAVLTDFDDWQRIGGEAPGLRD